MKGWGVLLSTSNLTAPQWHDPFSFIPRGFEAEGLDLTPVDVFAALTLCLICKTRRCCLLANTVAVAACSVRDDSKCALQSSICNACICICDGSQNLKTWL